VPGVIEQNGATPQPPPGRLRVLDTALLGEKELRKVADIEFMRRLHLVEGWSVRRIAKEFHIGRNTVHKYLGRDESTGVPRYTRRRVVVCPKMDPYREVIDAWLVADLKAPVKQRHTSHRIYERLVDEYGARVAESTVRRYVAGRRRVVAPKPAAAFLHLAFSPGELAQVDWGEANVRIAGVATKAYMFCMRLGHSTTSFVMLFPSARLECFLEAHVRAFEYFGGVPAEIVYDNLSSAVTRIVHRRGRVLNKTFETLVAHYVFRPVFANPASGWEKGLVEGLVGYSRRNYLVPVPEARSFDELNAKLRSRLATDLDRVVPERDGATVSQLLVQDRAGFVALPPAPYRACRSHDVHVTRQATVRHQRVQYSVPAALVGHDLRLDAFYDHLEIYERARLVARHALGTPGGPPVLLLDHYLEVLVRKPGGVRHARVVKDLGREVTAYRDAFLAARPDAFSAFVQILLLSRRYTLDAVLAGIAQAHRDRVYDTAQVEALIASHLGRASQPVGAIPASPAVHQHRPEIYDDLLRSAGVGR
jgi:transposase